MSVERQAVAGLKWSAAGKLVTQVVSWAITLYVMRLLEPGDYGLVALAMIVVGTTAAIAEAGLGASVVQARDVSRNELARVAGTLTAVNAACALVLVLLAPLVADLFGASQLAPVVRACSLQFMFNAIDAIPQSMATREMRFRWLAALEVAAALVTSAATLGLAALGAGVWSLVVGTLAGGATRSLLLVTQGMFVPPRFALKGMGRHFRFGGAVTAGRVLWQLAHQFDVMIAGRMLGKDAVGVYAVAMQLATLPMQRAMSIVNQVAFPAISRLQDELARLQAGLLDATRLLFFAAVPALWGISAVAPELVHVLLDERWYATTLPLQMAALAAPLRMLAAVLSTALAGMGRADLDLRNSIVTFVVYPLAFAVGVHWGIDGLAISWLAAVPIVFALNWPRTRATLAIAGSRFAAAAGAPVAAGVAMYAAVWSARPALESVSALARLPALIAVGAVVYLVVVTALDRRVWRDVRRFASALR